MIRTARLILREPVPADQEALLCLLSDPIIMEKLVREPTVAQAEASIRKHAGYRPAGLGFWVVEHDGSLAGWCGLKPGAEGTPIASELEIGWIFDRPYWGKGIAAEAARAVLHWAWTHRADRRVVAITGSSHAESRTLMERLGMRHLPEMDFEHHAYAEGDPMRPTVVYAIDRP